MPTQEHAFHWIDRCNYGDRMVVDSSAYPTTPVGVDPPTDHTEFAMSVAWTCHADQWYEPLPEAVSVTAGLVLIAVVRMFRKPT